MSDLNVRLVIGAALAGSHTQAMSTARKSIKDYATGIGTAIKQHKLFQAEIGKSDRMLKAAERRDAAASKMRAARGSMLVGGAAAFGMSKLIGAAADLEEEGLYLRTVINAQDGDKDAAVGRAMAHSRQFAQNSLASQQEVLTIEYALNSAGLSEEVSRAGTELVHKLAKVTKGAPEQVGEIFATTFNNLGEAMTGSAEEKMERIGNVLAKTQFKFQIRDFGQLGESMKYAASSMASAKVPLEQGAAVIGQLNTAGLQGSMAGTAFNAVLKNMGKASEELGFDMVRSADGSLDLMATLDGLKASLDGMDIDERGALLQELFSDEGKRGIVPLLDQLDQVKQAHEELKVAATSGLVNEEYARFLKSSGAQVTMLKQNLAQLGVVFAATLLPAVNAVVKPVARFAGWVAEGIAKYPILGDMIRGLVTCLVAIKVGMLLATAATWAWNAAWAANPITWIVVGIVAIGVAIYALAKNWDTVWSGIKTGAGVVWEFLKKMFAWTPLGLVMQAWGPALDFIGGAWEKIKSVGKFFGMGKGAVAGAAASLAVAATPLPADALPAMAGSASTNNSTVNAPIQIVQQPGQSGEEVAQAVSRELTARERQARSERNGRLYD
jgi:TP901 family phage tail tape measure protein